MAVYQMSLRRKALKRSLSLLERVVGGDSFETIAQTNNLTVEIVEKQCYNAARTIYGHSLKNGSDEIRNVESYRASWRNDKALWLRWITIVRKDYNF